MIHRAGVTGAILAGGRSTRMGRNKALLELNGRPFIQHVADTMAAVLPDVVVVADDVAPYRFLGLPVISDIHKGCGPIAGLHAALSHSESLVFILSCDTPFVSPDLIRYVIDFPTPVAANIVSFDGGLQPLCGLWSRECLPAIERRIAEGLNSMLGLLEEIRFTAVHVGPELPFHDPWLLKNFNSPEDLRILQ